MNTAPHNTIVVNGNHVPLTEGLSVADAVADLTGRDITAAGRAADGKPLGIAVALDHAVIPRSRWSNTLLEANQTVEIVTAVQGG